MVFILTSKILALRAKFARPCRQLMGLRPITGPTGQKHRALRALPLQVYKTTYIFSPPVTFRNIAHLLTLLAASTLTTKQKSNIPIYIYRVSHKKVYLFPSIFFCFSVHKFPFYGYTNKQIIKFLKDSDKCKQKYMIQGAKYTGCPIKKFTPFTTFYYKYWSSRIIDLCMAIKAS